MPPDRPGPDEIVAFLCDHHGGTVDGLEPLTGGHWSSAYGYRLGDEELVLRLGEVREGFEMDREAHAFCRPGLPVPEVLAIGEAFDGSFAVSRRHHGRFLEDISVDDAARAAPAIGDLLDALRAVPASDHRVTWFADQPEPTGGTWRGWLADMLVDDPHETVSGWRTTLAADPELDRLYGRCEQRVAELAEHCPERRDLVHGDLLHQNVLVSADASEVTAVFSWKCSVRGDHLYDVAWLTFWSPWHPGIDAVAVRSPVGAHRRGSPHRGRARPWAPRLSPSSVA